MMRYSVCVMMSTYNGEMYVKEQVESILNQSGVDVRLIIRDDGSSDRTIHILEEYVKQDRITFIKGKNIGAAYSFFELLKNSIECDFYAFSDQDDVWLQDKLISGVKKIKGQNGPMLYFSKKTIVDNNLKNTGIQDENIRGVTLNYSLLKGFANGCTMIFNNFLRKEIVKYTPKSVTMHDAWILMVAGAIGKIIYDKNSYILYRQHGKNVVGNQTRLKNFLRHIRRFWFYKTDDNRSQMSAQLISFYGNKMRKTDLENAKNLAKIRESVKYRRKLVFSHYFKTQNPVDIFPYKLIFALGWL